MGITSTLGHYFHFRYRGEWGITSTFQSVTPTCCPTILSGRW